MSGNSLPVTPGCFVVIDLGHERNHATGEWSRVTTKMGSVQAVKDDQALVMWEHSRIEWVSVHELTVVDAL